MSRIRSKNTAPEKLMFSYLNKNHIYFQKHYRKAPGNPDIAVPSRKLAVFIEGDFWHGWRFNQWSQRVSAFWRLKISDNIRRDKRNIYALRRQGWKILRIWEHELSIKSKRAKIMEKVGTFLSKE